MLELAVLSAFQSGKNKRGLPTVLVAEDDETDVFLLQRASRKVELPNEVLVVQLPLTAAENFKAALRHRAIAGALDEPSQ
jgi:hypothetical protein